MPTVFLNLKPFIFNIIPVIHSRPDQGDMWITADSGLRVSSRLFSIFSNKVLSMYSPSFAFFIGNRQVSQNEFEEVDYRRRNAIAMIHSATAAQTLYPESPLHLELHWDKDRFSYRESSNMEMVNDYLAKAFRDEIVRNIY